MSVLTDRLTDLLRTNERAADLLASISRSVSAKGPSGPGPGPKSSYPDIGKGPGAKGGGSPNMGSVLAGLGRVAGAASAAAGALVGIPLAAAGIGQLLSTFVGAFNPALVELFNLSLSGLMATIGSLAAPILAVITSLVSQISGRLLPLFTQLAPVVTQLSEALAGVVLGAVGALVGIVRLLVRVMTPVLPMFTALASYVGQVLEIWGVVAEVLSSFADVITLIRYATMPYVAALTDLTGEAGGLAPILKQLAGAAGLAVGGLLKLFNATTAYSRFTAGLRRSIEARRNPAAGLTAAPQAATITGFEEISKRFTEAAFKATAGGPGAARSDTQILEEVLSSVEDGFNMDWKKTITEAIRDATKDTAVGRAATAVELSLDSSAAATTSSRWAAGRASGGLLGGGAAAATGWATDAVSALKFW